MPSFSDLTQTIVVITALNDSSRAALDSLVNADRIRPTDDREEIQQPPMVVDWGSREVTPFDSPPPRFELHLSLDNPPKVPRNGHYFGTKPGYDIVFQADQGEKGGVSSRHFLIKFNWRWSTILITNLSRFGTRISGRSVYNQTQLLLDNATYSLDKAETTVIGVGRFEFNFDVPIRNPEQERAYQQNFQAYRMKYENMPPDVTMLGITSQMDPTTLHQYRDRRYHLHTIIGEGQFGRVSMVKDMSTGDVFAAKGFKKRSKNISREAGISLAA